MNDNQETQIKEEAKEETKSFLKTPIGITIIVIVFAFFVLLLVGGTKDNSSSLEIQPLTEGEKAAFEQRVKEANIPPLTEEEKSAFEQRVKEAGISPLTEDQKEKFKNRLKN